MLDNVVITIIAVVAMSVVWPLMNAYIKRQYFSRWEQRLLKEESKLFTIMEEIEEKNKRLDQKAQELARQELRVGIEKGDFGSSLVNQPN